MNKTRTLRIWGSFLLLLLLLLTFLLWNIFAGSVSLSASEIWRILLGSDVGFTQSQIIVKIRLPRLLSALILGGALSLSGYLLQNRISTLYPCYSVNMLQLIQIHCNNMKRFS